MSDILINPVSSVKLSDPGALVQAPLPQATEVPAVSAIPGQTEAAQAVRTGTTQTQTSPAKEKPSATPQSKPSLPVSNYSDIYIHFRVDQKTHNLTAFVVDRKSKRVIRSIPPEELAKLQAGDLLKLTA